MASNKVARGLLICLFLLSAAQGQRLEAGERAPAMSLKGLDGTQVRYAPPAADGPASERVTVVAFIDPGKRLSLLVLSDLRAIARADGELAGRTDFIAVASGKLDEDAEAVIRERLPKNGPIAVALDPERKAYTKFGVIARPTTFVIDTAGTIAHVVPGRSSAYRKRVVQAIRDSLGMKQPEKLERDETQDRIDRLQNLARDLIRRRRGEEAVAPLQKACGLAPENSALHVALGDLFLRLDKAAEATAAFEAALKLAPNDRSAKAGVAKAMALGDDLDAAEKALRKAMRRPPVDPALFYFLGRVQERREEWQKAAASYRSAFERLR